MQNLHHVNSLEDIGDYRWLCSTLGISPHTARRWVMEGRIPSFKLAGGKLLRFRKSEIARWLDEQSRNPGRPA